MANSKLRDIEASVNSFYNSIASNFNMAGYNRDILKEYVPALVYTMYDGYYIYSPYTNTIDEDRGEYAEGTTYQNGERLSGLKPYIYYSCRYKSSNYDFVISYSLDNYITIYGDTPNKKGVYDAGYLINNCSVNGEDSATYRGTTIDEEILSENVYDENTGRIEEYIYTKINGVKYYYDGNEWFSILNGEKQTTSEKFKTVNNSAVKYYTDAADFKSRINKYGIVGLTTEKAVDENGNSLKSRFGNYEIFEGLNGNNPRVAIEDPNSNFNQHRLAVIRYSIERNLSIAIANYNNYSGVKANFLMPTLKENEWEKIINNVSIISFLQGLNIGGKIYNGYSIITNTKNEEVVTEDSIYITTNDNQYHKVTDNDLTDGNVVSGVFNVDFERKSIINNEGNTEYFYPKEQSGCYSSIVNHIGVNDTDNIYEYVASKGGKLAQKYFTALGRERYGMYKTKNNSEELKKLFYE